MAYIARVAPLLAEELAVLGCSPTGSSLILPLQLDRGVAGALLADLAAASRIGYVPGGVVTITDRTATGRPVLDMVLQEIARQDRTPRAWVSKLASRGPVRQVKRVPSRIGGPRRMLRGRATSWLPGSATC